MQLIGEKREGDISLSVRAGGVITVDETYHYTVRANSTSQNRLDVITYSALPVVGQTLSAGGLAVCKSKQATRRADNPIIWDVVCTFSSEVQEDSNQSEQPPGSDPNAWIPVRRTMFERMEEVSMVDQAGNAITNSAGQAYDTGIVRPRYIPVWEFTQFEPITVTDETIIDRNETVNSATFKGKGAKTLLLTVVDSVVGFYYGQRRRLTTYRLKYNSRDWRQRRLDVGTVYKVSTNLIPFTDKAGNVILGALDGSGNPQTGGTAPAIRVFDQYATSTFSFLRI